MYKIYRRWGDGAGGGPKNRSLGNYRDMIFKKIKFYVFLILLFFLRGGALTMSYPTLNRRIATVLTILKFFYRIIII